MISFGIVSIGIVKQTERISNCNMSAKTRNIRFVWWLVLDHMYTYIYRRPELSAFGRLFSNKTSLLVASTKQAAQGKCCIWKYNAIIRTNMFIETEKHIAFFCRLVRMIAWYFQMQYLPCAACLVDATSRDVLFENSRPKADSFGPKLGMMAVNLQVVRSGKFLHGTVDVENRFIHGFLFVKLEQTTRLLS